MAYSINLTNGTTLIPGGLSDGTVDTSHSSLTLVGKNYSGYGQFLNDNFIHLLENFAATSSPANPLKGQLWWDTTNNILKVYSGTSWKISTGATSSPFNSPPGDLSTIGGDLWFDTSNSQLKVFNGSIWITIGPVSTPATGDTGAVPANMTDLGSGTTKTVIQLKFFGTIYAIFSKETFTSSLTGFPLIKAGLNFSTIASPTWGISTQDVNPTGSTLVIRDSSGGINGNAIVASAITAATVSASTITGSFVGSIVGNVNATTITSTTINTSTLQAAGVSASSGFSGPVLTASQPYITGLGNVVNLSTNGTTNLTGTAYYNGSPIATIGGSATFSSINTTPIGNIVPSTGAFTTLSASTSITGTLATASQPNITTLGGVTSIGASSATTLTGTLQTASQPNVTAAAALASVGNITTGTWSGTVVKPQYGGTGVNNGTNTLTLGGGNWTINQAIASGSAPTFTGTNFSSIPNGALSNSSITVTAGTGLSGGGTVAVGGSTTINLNIGNYVATITGTTNQVIASASTGGVTLSLPQAIHTGAGVQFGAIGVGVTASGTTGEIRATNNVTAYYSSDAKFKENVRAIPNALATVLAIGGDLFDWTDEYVESKGGEDGYFVQKEDFGVIAQKVKAVFPQAVRTREDGSLAVDYAKLSALSFAAIVELNAKLDAVLGKI